MKPIIGITTHDDKNKGIYRVNNDYVYAIMDSGGLVVNLPSVKYSDDLDQYLDLVDGLVFTGGVDISPLYYGENPRKEVVSISNKRDSYEMELFKRAYKRRIPMLGICRGMQLGNVALNGSLYQDIYEQTPDSLGHEPEEEMVDQPYHQIKIREDSNMYKIFKKKKIMVNSLHHQAIKDLGDNLAISSIAADGVIESIESTNESFFLGVQFHPEALARNYPQFARLFEKFIKLCREEK